MSSASYLLDRVRRRVRALCRRSTLVWRASRNAAREPAVAARTHGAVSLRLVARLRAFDRPGAVKSRARRLLWIASGLAALGVASALVLDASRERDVLREPDAGRRGAPLARHAAARGRAGRRRLAHARCGRAHGVFVVTDTARVST